MEGFYNYPRHIEYWVTDDGRTFTTESEAVEHAKMLSHINHGAIKSSDYSIKDQFDNLPYYG